jgi:hypothetical protein
VSDVLTRFGCAEGARLGVSVRVTPFSSKDEAVGVEAKFSERSDDSTG